MIVPLQDGSTVPIRNPYAYGNAWFVNNVKFVDNANQELDALGTIHLRQEAVADKHFKDVLGESKTQDNLSVVTLSSYEPNHLKYDVQSGQGGVVVFSEVYYPGWTATVDGQPAELGRVDYLLRALKVSPGNHQVELMFYPQSINTTETMAYVAYAVLILALLLVVFYEWKKRK